MKARTIAPIALSALLGAQDPVMVELPAGIRITREDYQDYLFEVIGSARLEELLFDRILEREAAKLPLDDVANDVRAGLADPDAYARRMHARMIELHYGGDEQRWLDLVQRIGHSVEGELANLRRQALRQLRTTALVQARRQPDAARTRRVFEQHYGVDGLRVRVRHAFVPYTDQQERKNHDGPARKTADELWQAYLGGAPFEDLVMRAGNDPQAQDPAHRADAGLLPGYDFQRFGVPFAEAVRAMQPGEVRGPIATPQGYHIIKLDSVTRTRFEDVRDEVARLVREEPASLGEQRQLREALWAQYRVAEALGR